MRGIRSIRAFAVVVVLLAGGPAGAVNSSADDPLGMGRALLAAAQSEAPAEVFERVQRAQGFDIAPVPPSPLASIDAPDPIAPALGSLIGAARTAERLREEAVAGLSAAERSAILDALHVARPAADAGDGSTSVLAINAMGLNPSVSSIAAKVDMIKLQRAAAVILRAIDVAGPMLRRRTNAQLVQSACGASGDMVFESSDCQIMVGGPGANTYGEEVDPLLLVDLGGDDTYTNDTGVANTEVRIVVDVAGDDTYDRQGSDDAPGTEQLAIYGQGVGAIGVGVLADLGGNDRYAVGMTTSAPDPGPAARPAAAVGQGWGVAGVGVLVDVGGANSFSLRASSTGGAASVMGQGQGQLGVGALLSLSPEQIAGTGDSYDASATSTLHRIQQTDHFSRFSIGSTSALVQGSGDQAGSGVLVDAAGNDTYAVTATGASASILAQGASRSAAAALVDLAGDDIMSVAAIGDARLSLVTTNPSLCWTATVVVTTSATEAYGHGGTSGGAAVLADGGGNDTRTLTAHSRAEAIATVTSEVDCSALGGNTATATANTGDGRVIGQGAGSSNGIGLLTDVGGDDRNELDASSEAHATAQAFAPGLITETPSANAGTAAARGQGFSTSAIGVLTDAFGDDSYGARSATAASETTSAGTSEEGAPGTIEVHGWGGPGYALFVDLDGDDSYDAGPDSAAADESCWSNTATGRGYDIHLTAPPPAGCS